MNSWCSFVNMTFAVTSSVRVHTLAKALSPAYLRFGGTAADFLIFRQNPSDLVTPGHRKNCWLPEDCNESEMTKNFTNFYMSGVWCKCFCFMLHNCLQCFDTVGWVSGRAGRQEWHPACKTRKPSYAKVNARQHCVSLSCLCNNLTQIVSRFISPEPLRISA